MDRAEPTHLKGHVPSLRAVQDFIRANLHVLPVPSIPEIRLYTAHPASGLRRLAGPGDADPPSPYWAYPWAGGAALARHFLDRPQAVKSRRVLDLGSGSGLVAIAAAKAGAGEVIAADIDPNAMAALGLNAAENDVAIAGLCADITAGPPPAVDLVAVGDLFYEQNLAGRVTGFLDRCLAAGVEVLVGDPYRAWLPRERLRLIAEYAVADFGDIKGAAARPSGVFRFEAA